MVFRTNGYMGCLVGIIVFMLFFYLIRFTGWLVFTTPVGLVLVAYIAYRYFKKNRNQSEVTNDYPTHEPEFKPTDDVVDVDFEELD